MSNQPKSAPYPNEPPPPYSITGAIGNQPPPPPGFIQPQIGPGPIFHQPRNDGFQMTFQQGQVLTSGAAGTGGGGGGIGGPSITFGALPPPLCVNLDGGNTVTHTTVIVQQGFGPYPIQVTCPNCNASVLTETNASPGLLTFLLSGTLLLVGCWLGCCLIPCCIPECQDIEHRCPNCKSSIGTYRRL